MEGVVVGQRRKGSAQLGQLADGGFGLLAAGADGSGGRIGFGGGGLVVFGSDGGGCGKGTVEDSVGGRRRAAAIEGDTDGTPPAEGGGNHLTVHGRWFCLSCVVVWCGVLWWLGGGHDDTTLRSRSRKWTEPARRAGSRTPAKVDGNGLDGRGMELKIGRPAPARPAAKAEVGRA